MRKPNVDENWLRAALDEVLALLEEIEADACVSDPGVSTWGMWKRARACLRAHGRDPSVTVAQEKAAEVEDRKFRGVR